MFTAMGDFDGTTRAPDGRHVVAVGLRGDRGVCDVDGRELGPFSTIGGRAFFTGPSRFHLVARRGTKLVNVELSRLR